MLQSEKTNYLYDGMNVFKEYGENGDPLAHYYSGADGEVIARQTFGFHDRKQYGYEGNIRTRGGLMYYEYDGLGNVMDITDRIGSQVMAYRYDAFGNLFTQMAAPYNAVGYTGKTYDAKASLMDYSARWYSPNNGRFINQDTNEGNLSSPQTLNRYSYVENNPVNFTDPTGHTSYSGTLTINTSSTDPTVGDTITLSADSTYQVGQYRAIYIHDLSGDSTLSGTNQIEGGLGQTSMTTTATDFQAQTVKYWAALMLPDGSYVNSDPIYVAWSNPTPPSGGTGGGSTGGGDTGSSGGTTGGDTGSGGNTGSSSGGSTGSGGSQGPTLQEQIDQSQAAQEQVAGQVPGNTVVPGDSVSGSVTSNHKLLYKGDVAGKYVLSGRWGGPSSQQIANIKATIVNAVGKFVPPYIVRDIAVGALDSIQSAFWRNVESNHQNELAYYAGRVLGDVLVIGSALGAGAMGAAAELFGVAADSTGIGAIFGAALNVGGAVAIRAGYIAALRAEANLVGDGANLISYIKSGDSGGQGSSKGQTFRGGSKATRDKWYGYNNKDFQNWWHRVGKREWGGQDIQDAQMAKEVYDYWLENGKPKVK